MTVPSGGVHGSLFLSRADGDWLVKPAQEWQETNLALRAELAGLSR